MATTVESTQVEVMSNEIKKPWSAKATLGLTLLIFIFYFLISINVDGGSGILRFHGKVVEQIIVCEQS